MCSVKYLSLNTILSNSSFVEAVINGLNLNAPAPPSYPYEAAKFIPFLTSLNIFSASFVLAKLEGKPCLNFVKLFVLAALLILLALIPVAPSASGSLSPADNTFILSKL